MDGEKEHDENESTNLGDEFAAATGGEEALAVDAAPEVARGKTVETGPYMRKAWGAAERQLMRMGGLHWKLDGDEQSMWFDSMEMGYPELDLAKYGKLLFWGTTAYLFIPRIIISVGMAVAIAKGRRIDAGGIGSGDGDDLGEAGEREDSTE